MRACFAALLLLAFVSTVLGSCAAPTQIILHVHTDVACSSPPWPGVAVFVGAPDASLEEKLPVLSEQRCDANGEIGTLVVTPSGAKNAEVGLRVVAGIERRPEECAANDYRGCIVARRAVRFDRHETIHVDVRLTRSCIDFGCNAGSTCVDGECRALTQIPNTGIPSAEGDASSSGGRVRCGDSGLFCPTEGDVCCLTIDRAAGTTSGECKPADTCILPKIVLRCDDESDCAALTDDRGHPGSCLLSYTDIPGAPNSTSPDVVSAANCAPYSVLEGIAGKALLALCNDRDTCLDGSVLCEKSDSSLPNYMWCAAVAPFAESPGAPRVRCGDDGLSCPTTGNVCCLTVDRDAQTAKGKCMSAADCPSTSIVLKCDDETDCADRASADGTPGICSLAYEPFQGNNVTPNVVSGSECLSAEDFRAQHGIWLGLCDRSGTCLNRFGCSAMQGQPTNPMPGYFACSINISL